MRRLSSGVCSSHEIPCTPYLVLVLKNGNANRMETQQDDGSGLAFDYIVRRY